MSNDNKWTLLINLAEWKVYLSKTNLIILKILINFLIVSKVYAQVNLNATNREVEGKSSSRQLRRAGSIPAVIYGGEIEPIRISILEKDIAKASEIPGFATQILNINIGG